MGIASNAETAIRALIRPGDTKCIWPGEEPRIEHSFQPLAPKVWQTLPNIRTVRIPLSRRQSPRTM